MRTLTFLLAPLALTLALPAAAQAQIAGQPPVAANATLLSLTTQGKSTRTPDLAVFNAGVVTQGVTASEALSANAAAMNRVIATLKKAGIADRDIQTSQINLNPVYSQPEYGPNGVPRQEPRITGYQAVNNVTIRSRNVAGFGKVLDALVASGANQVNGPAFQMAEPAAAMDEARLDAMKSARARAELYARAAGLRVVRIVSISEGGGFSPPQPVYMRAMKAEAAAAPTPIAVGEVEAEVNLSVQFELAP